MRSTFTIFSNGLIILPGFKFTELYALTLAACSYALLLRISTINTENDDVIIASTATIGYTTQQGSIA